MKRQGKFVTIGIICMPSGEMIKVIELESGYKFLRLTELSVLKSMLAVIENDIGE